MRLYIQFRRKKEDPCDAVGVITYRMREPSKHHTLREYEEPTVAVMFSVPFTGNNLWNATVYSNTGVAARPIIRYTRI